MSEAMERNDVSTPERAVYGILGASLIPIGLRRGGLVGALLAAGGTWLAYRGVSGKGPLYRRRSGGWTGALSDTGVTVRRSVTVDLTPTETYMNLRRFESLPSVMAHLESVAKRDDGSYLWRLREGAMTFDCITRLTDDRPGESFRWESLEESDIRCDGQILLRSAPGRRGTEIHIDVTVAAPGGRATALLAPLVQRVASHQVEREVHRVKHALDNEGVPDSSAHSFSEQAMAEGQPV